MAGGVGNAERVAVLIELIVGEAGGCRKADKSSILLDLIQLPTQLPSPAGQDK